MPDSLLLFALAILLGLGVLTWSSDKFVDGVSSLARITGISPLIIGMVVMGFGTSMPEITVSLMAAMQGVPGIALGNAVGSNIANIALILGITAVIRPLEMHSGIVKRELPLLLAVGGLSWLLLLDRQLSRTDGLVLLVVLAAVLMGLVRMARSHTRPEAFLDEISSEIPAPLPKAQAIFWTLAGLLLLVGSSQLLVWGATGIAAAFGISDLVIGLTIVAVGTSLPELAASLASARKGEADLAVGNVVGSNLFNNLAVMGLPALFRPIPAPPELLTRDLPIMLGLTMLLVIFNFTPPWRRMIARHEGAVLLAAFIAYQLLLYHQSLSVGM